MPAYRIPQPDPHQSVWQGMVAFSRQAVQALGLTNHDDDDVVPVRVSEGGLWVSPEVIKLFGEEVLRRTNEPSSVTVSYSPGIDSALITEHKDMSNALMDPIVREMDRMDRAWGVPSGTARVRWETDENGWPTKATVYMPQDEED